MICETAPYSSSIPDTIELEVEKRLGSLILHMDELVDKNRPTQDQNALFYVHLLLMWVDFLENHNFGTFPGWDENRIRLDKVIERFDLAQIGKSTELREAAEKGAALRNQLESLRKALANDESLSSRFEGFFPEEDVFRCFERAHHINVLNHQLDKLAAHRNELQHLVYYTFDEGTIQTNPNRGIADSFILSDGTVRYLIKLDDSRDSRYRTILNDAVSYQIAELARLNGITPETHLALVNGHLLTQQAPADAMVLVSAQSFVEGAKQLGEVLQDFQQEGLTDDEIANLIDQTDFEEAWLLEHLIGDTDGHFGNFLAYVKDSEKPTFGIKVIDNSFSLHNQRGPTYCALHVLPNAKRGVSDALRKKVHDIDLDEMCQMLDTFDKASAKQALSKRVQALKYVIDEDLTIGELHQKLNGDNYEIPHPSRSLSSHPHSQHPRGGLNAAR